jgi:hypothetical protein
MSKNEMNNSLYSITDRKGFYGVLELIREEDNINHKSVRVVFIPKTAKNIEDNINQLTILNRNTYRKFSINFIDLKQLGDDEESIIYEARNFEIIR